MTWIVDGNGRRWVEVPQKKRRKSPRALRFAELKVGDQIMQKPSKYWDRKFPSYFIVVYRWFDPVEGHEDPVAGEMVGYQRIGQNGGMAGSVWKTTLRGLASQRFHYADVDYIALCQARAEAVKDGTVVPMRRKRKWASPSYQS